MSLVQEMDGKKTTIGGIITGVRSIITKSGTKMAFVAIEDKTGESELIVFPDLYKQVGPSLAIDAVIRSNGRLNAKDRDGNLTSDVKLIADDVVFVSEKELREYESHGVKMTAPKKAQNSVVTKKVEKKVAPPTARPEAPLLQQLYVHVKNPDDQDKLRFIRSISAKFPGMTEVVLVLGDTEKSAIRLPFKVERSDTLIGELVKHLGEDCVTVK